MSAPLPLIRAPVAGDHGHVITRHAVLYQQEQGWDGERFERAVVTVMHAFLQGFDPARDRAWIADWDHKVAGSVYIMHTDQPGVARLRMLYLVQGRIQRIHEEGGLWHCQWHGSSNRLHPAA